jgi:hypothetical protein
LTLTAGIAGARYEKDLRVLLARQVDPRQIARGHDITAVIAWAVVILGGKKRKYGALITGDVIESYLRTAYRHEDFIGTELHAQLEGWEMSNAPYKVVRR